jgi:glucose/arabinose dehydrogenase
MDKKHILFLFFLALLLAGCRQGVGLFDERVDATPTSTSMPLPDLKSSPQGDTPAPAPTRTPAPTQAPTATRTVTPARVPTVTPSPSPAAPVETRVVSPAEAVHLPPGFGVSVFADRLSDPRMMALGPEGMLYVAERGRGRIVRLPDRDGDGVADGVEVVADQLRAPSSIAFDANGAMYVGETTRVLRLSDADEQGVFHQREVIVDGLPSGGHSTRTVLLSPDGEYLYVSVGSSCNVCVESDERRAAIVRYRPDGSEESLYARGLRNAVGITFRPGTGELWATNNGRDWLGDDQPPETVYRVREGDDAGWPRCHAGRIEDPDYGRPGACEGVARPEVEMQAHSAPLGLAFYDGDQFPEAYRGDLFVALHGSWNRTVPTGYKVVRIPMQGAEAGPAQDFASGWLREDGSNWGRPVDVIAGAEGSLFVSDDGGGAIYRIYYAGE